MSIKPTLDDLPRLLAAEGYASAISTLTAAQALDLAAQCRTNPHTNRWLVIASLLEDRENLKAKDRMFGKISPADYLALVENRKVNHQPIPPGQYFRHAGHHWLMDQPHLSGSANMGHLMVAQWSPTQHLWYASNALASTEKPLYGDGLMTHWKWVAAIPVPENL